MATPFKSASARPVGKPGLDRAPPWQGLAAALVFAALVFAALAWLAHNAVAALARRNIDIDFAFLLRPAGFDIPFKLRAWESSDSYGYTLLVAGLNTVLASVLATIGATLLGLLLLGLLLLGLPADAAALGRQAAPGGPPRTGRRGGAHRLDPASR